MSTIVYFNSEHVAVSSEQRVFNKKQATEFDDLIHKASELTRLIDTESDRINQKLDEGYNEGYASGQDKGYNDALEHVARKLVVLSKEAADSRAKLEQDAASIATAIVERIASTMAPADVVAALATTAAQELVEKEIVVLHVNNSVFDEVVSRFSNSFTRSISTDEISTVDETGLTAASASNKEIHATQANSVTPATATDVPTLDAVFDVTSTCQLTVKSNGQLQELDCILETASGKVNASLEIQLRTVEKYLVR